ncbi:hypothetical protein GGS20DRAFT_592862 [Poronia punctata]|nr:hypothetical protein GGS20DRAFT_592862 [Poronia punctata]
MAEPASPGIEVTMLPEVMEYIINHVVLPPKLPQEDDYDRHHEDLMVLYLIGSFEAFRAVLEKDKSIPFSPVLLDNATHMLNNLHAVHNSTASGIMIDKERLYKALTEVHENSGPIPLCVRAQNAGILISPSSSNSEVLFELFELLPENNAVMSIAGRLQRTFPGSAVAVPASEIQNPDFLDTLTSTLVMMSGQAAAGIQSDVQNAERNTTHPKIVTELLAAYLASIGSTTQVASIRKNTRQEVLMKDARLPWHRSALWVLIRVSLQLVLSRSELGSLDSYKNYMLFLNAHLLNETQSYDISSDLIWSVKAKVLRRRLKLGALVHPDVLKFVEKAMFKAESRIKARWSQIQEADSVAHDFANWMDLSSEQHTLVTLHNLDAYIKRTGKNEQAMQQLTFRGSCPLKEFVPTLGICITDYFGDAKPLVHKILKFENWVDQKLDTWLETTIKVEETCEYLNDALEMYHKTAICEYRDNPEATSNMFLTVLHLWVALDKTAIQACPLLKNYDHGFPVDITSHLILPTIEQMERLQSIEQYFGERTRTAVYSNQCIANAPDGQDFFAVQYFNQSTQQQDLLQDIEKRATAVRDDKLLEFRTKHERYTKDRKRLNKMKCRCDEMPFHTYGRKRYRTMCDKCKFQEEIESVVIESFEWPLPEDEIEAKIVVFEMCAPISFVYWRDCRLHVLLDILNLRYSSDASPTSISRFEHNKVLREVYQAHDSRHQPRLRLVSPIRAHAKSHKIKDLMPTGEAEVCIKNGMKPRYMDDVKDCYSVDLEQTDALSVSCTFRLSATSHPIQLFLQKGLTGGAELPNAAIATQSGCPHDISLEEYKRIVALMSGSRIKWQSILKELTCPEVDFRKEDIALVVLQCIEQAGPAEGHSLLRRTHCILDEERFSSTLLGNLEDSCRRISKNWQSAPALSVFISIANRIHWLSSVPSIRESCRKVMFTAREIALRWIGLLNQKADTALEDVRRELIWTRTLIALVCADSFNVDDENLRLMLCDPAQTITLIRLAMIIRNGEQLGASSKKSKTLKLLLEHRWKKLCLRGYPMITRAVIKDHSPALDEAIKLSWDAYQPTGKWRTLKRPYRHWLCGQSLLDGSDSDNEPQAGNFMTVHFSLITGQLLINGFPLNRLPEEYEEHPTYHALFGKSSRLDITPSIVKGMRFSGKKLYAGHEVHFNMVEKQHASKGVIRSLQVQASEQNSMFEFLPPRLLRDHFPPAFVENFVHWYDRIEDCVEFCPRKTPWLHSDDHWRLRRVLGSNGWQLTNQDRLLVSKQSPTALRLHGVFKALEDPSHIHITVSPESCLYIDLPRLQLTFSTSSVSGSIGCHQHRGMSIHEDQGIGTLIGLKSKLVLKSKKPGGRDKVIIPNGAISHEVQGHHVWVNVEADSSAKTIVYEVDRQLGRIIDNGTMRSKIYLAYLHALTTFCLPDPLTGLTGTEAALVILRSAAVRSFLTVSQEDEDLLLQISMLTPQREFYPKNATEMATVHWSSKLGFLAQHSGYYESVRSILKHFESMRVFGTEPLEIPRSFRTIHALLVKREKIRSAAFRSSGFGAEWSIKKFDSDYSQRDRSHSSKECMRALSMSSIIYRDEFMPRVEIEGDVGVHLWHVLCGVQGTLSASQPDPGEKFRYDAALLVDSSENTAQSFLRFLKALRATKGDRNVYRVMIWLATLAFAKDADMTMIHVLAAAFTSPDTMNIAIPNNKSFKLRYGLEPTKFQLLQELTPTTIDFELAQDFVSDITNNGHETEEGLRCRRRREFEKRRDEGLGAFAKALLKQWPCEQLHQPKVSGGRVWSKFIKVDKAMARTRHIFHCCSNNIRLREYLAHVDDSLPRTSRITEASFCMPLPPHRKTRKIRGFVTSGEIFAEHAPQIGPAMGVDLDMTYIHVRPQGKGDSSLLPHLLSRLDKLVDSEYEVNYMADMASSLAALREKDPGYEVLTDFDELSALFVQHREACEGTVRAVYSAMEAAVMKCIQQRLNRCAHAVVADSAMQHFPQPHPIFFLRRLVRKRWARLSEGWKRCIIAYGVSLTKLQQAYRFLAAIEDLAALKKELDNPGHTNWDPYEHPESLLLEVESGILIRSVQEQISGQMRDPPSGKNAVMQLNMGEGKSSVIIPTIAASLADTTRLVRVVVAKPQSKQMLQMLVAKLGGVLNRQIYHLPFSRALKVDEASSEIIRHLLDECKSSGGILLTHPENILSFMLMGIESTLSGNSRTSQILTQTLRFLDTHSRDIVDESDENFSVKFELVYTIGLQRPIPYSPERWLRIQTVLDIFRAAVPDVRSSFPDAIMVTPQPNGGFPRTRTFLADVQYQIMLRIAHDICSKGLRGFPIVRQGSEFRRAVFSYITEPVPNPAVISVVEDDNPTGFWANSHETLLLLRGLLAGGVLDFCFRQKRWRVDYGCDVHRRPATKLALPFRAKDSPTPRSEFSHPDVVIVLTHLSYYYGGLSNEELALAFRHVLNSDQADVEFQDWVRGCTDLPMEFQQLGGVNLEDRVTCEEEIFPHLRFSQGAINYFLANNVFPKEMKEFPSKLCASGWDIGKVKTYPTTGFSGTNDSRAVLPLTVDQLDLREQQHTNALVLENLLQPENSVALMPSQVNGYVSDAKLLLDMVIRMDPEVRVILDVGAQVLELDNLDMAQEWLSSIQDVEGTEAAVFFNVDDELAVVDREGHVELLQVSPYMSQLDLCLIFLDEAHTRGTELRLPRYYRAAVTLGANLTKDRLMQACMRMRLLGEGQSVVFCVPQEISSKVQRRLSSADPPPEPGISVSDILAWSITETWEDTKRNIPLWAAQGRRQATHQELWAECHANGDILTQELAESFLEDEGTTLERQYRPAQGYEDEGEEEGEEGEGEDGEDAITLRCRQFKDIKDNTTAFLEEQERELAPEVEVERQDERPKPVQHETPKISRDVRAFIKTGKIVEESNGYMAAFVSMGDTSAGAVFDVAQFRRGVLISRDFARTIKTKPSATAYTDAYKRSVQWVLTGAESPQDDASHMMIISPFEANELLEDIRASSFVALHLYGPRRNLGYPSLEKLDLYTVPQSLASRKVPGRLITELNLFAGQLYLSSYTEYVAVCDFLGLAHQLSKEGETIGADGFICQDSTGRIGGESGFRNSPVEFFKIFLAKIRWNCETIDRTHMGKILDSRLLTPADFE